MKRMLFLAVVAAGCATTPPPEPPEPTITTQAHPEFDKWRPVAIAVLPVEAPAHQLRREVRRDVYNQLFERMYSPFKLEVVDAHLGPDGALKGDDLAWDATLAVRIDEFRPVGGTDKYVVSASAVMKHKNGEVLWECHVRNQPFEVDRHDYTEAASGIATLLTSSNTLPERPPLPVE